MSEEENRPDTARIMSGLKDFQRRTVEHVFRRMFVDKDYTRRFLIADEVGLGKTLVAQGVIARTIDHLWDSVRRIDIVYICSNADIARQNIRRLNVLNDKEFTLPDRITLLPEKVHGLEKKRVNFVAFTPGTSFHLKSASGRVEERAMLYRLLKEPWNLRGKAPLYTLRGNTLYENFQEWIDYYTSAKVTIDPGLEQAFLRELKKKIAEAQQAGKEDLRTRFEKLCTVFNRSDARIGQEEARARKALVGELRALLAAVCIEALDPNLIILDEFQRFKDLFNADSDAGMLAQNLFRYVNEKEGSQARVLLLSATPYKMFSMNHETGMNDHYADFLHTLDFLCDDPGAVAGFRSLLSEYGAQFFQHGGPDQKRLVELKSELEGRLQKVMARTERLTVSEDRDGMLRQMSPPGHALRTNDLHAYVKQAKVAELLGHASVVEYWKSAPYLLNFMDEYELKRKFKREANRRGAHELATLLGGHKHTLLKWSDITGYREVDPANAKLRALLADTVDRGMWRLLWLPPSLPYYTLRGAYSDAVNAGMTKRLLFSCWNVVPKVVAALASYEAERCAILSLDPSAKNTTDERRKRRPLLRFTLSDGRLTGMPALGTLYPSTALADLCDPLAIRRAMGDSVPSLAFVLEEARKRVERASAFFSRFENEAEPADERWYWAAPVLLDLAKSPERTQDWFEQTELIEAWRRHTRRAAAEDDSSGHWGEHIETMRRLASEARSGQLKLGRRPDNLTDVLAKIGVGGFGCCAVRAFTRLDSEQNQLTVQVLNEAGALAHAFVSLFNLPETMAIVRAGGDREPYWLQAVEYSCEGCLQAVLDEYAHVLRESLGLMNQSLEEAASALAEAVAFALTIRTSRVGVDCIKVTARKGIDVHAKTMRTRFAMRFSSDTSEDGAETTREDQVRAAFNSPFWPFILATTSVGQEGLDFHPYCHAVVHWNLPSNPVDLEQREGRVHRYKGHAVRKNLARGYSQAAWQASLQDPWEAMFIAARKAAGAASEIEPFWVLTAEGGAFIERHIMNLPLSRDEHRLQELLRSLTVYRMVFGQPRQEDLMAYLLEQVAPGDRALLAEKLRINLEPQPPGGTYGIEFPGSSF